MKYTFSRKTLNAYFPDFRWETTGSQLIGIKYMENSKATVCVCINDYNKPSSTGAWNYSLYETEGDISTEPLDEILEKSKFITMVQGLFTDINLQQITGTDDNLPLVVAICGSSGCGKTSLVNYLKEKHNIPTIISYTTRPIRPDEKDGEQHWFVTADKIPPKEKQLAYTKFGNYEYWANLSDLKDVPAITYTIDEQGILDLLEIEKQGKIKVAWIQIYRENNPTDEERLARDADREPAKKKLKELNIYPNAVIYNNYPSVDEFLSVEGPDLASFIEMMSKGLDLNGILNI